MPLGAGKRNQRITFQVRAEGTDAAGQPNGEWAALAVRPNDWAFVKPLRGAEFLAAGQFQARVDVVFNIRYRSDVNERMRIVWNGEVYEITSPPKLVNGMKVDMELMCSAGISNA
jgi:SPP1 family predicted phage head-tail adaptor